MPPMKVCFTMKNPGTFKQTKKELLRRSKSTVSSPHQALIFVFYYLVYFIGVRSCILRFVKIHLPSIHVCRLGGCPYGNNNKMQFLKRFEKCDYQSVLCMHLFNVKKNYLYTKYSVAFQSFTRKLDQRYKLPTITENLKNIQRNRKISRNHVKSLVFVPHSANMRFC